MEEKKEIRLKLREAYQKLLPYSARMTARRQLMARVPLNKRQFENRITNKVEIDLTEAVLWAQELGVDVNDLWELV